MSILVTKTTFRSIYMINLLQIQFWKFGNQKLDEIHIIEYETDIYLLI